MYGKTAAGLFQGLARLIALQTLQAVIPPGDELTGDFAQQPEIAFAAPARV